MSLPLFTQSNQSQTLYNSALHTAWRSGVQLYDPDVWLEREPEIEEAMLRDADIAQALTVRRHMVAGRDWNLVPKDDAAETAGTAVEVGTELLGAIRKFTSARFNLARASFSGARFAYIHGSIRTLNIGDGKPRRWWVPQRLEDIDKRRFRFQPIVDANKETIGGHWERFNVASGQWRTQEPSEVMQTIRHVYQDDEGTLGHGRGLREALGWWWYAKTNTLQETLQAVERYGQGIISAKIGGLREANGKPNTELLAEWQAVLEDLRARHVLVYDENDSVEVIHPAGTGWQLLGEVRQELRTTITTLILGANLTTSADSGGSYALARVQENSTEALVQFDREILEEVLTDDLLGCVWCYNHPNMLELGIADEMPRFTIKQEKRQEPIVRAQAAEIVSRMGVPIAVDDVRDQTGFRPPEDGEQIVEPPQPQALPGLPFRT